MTFFFKETLNPVSYLPIQSSNGSKSIMKKATFLFPEVLMAAEFVTEFTYDVFKTQNKKIY